MNYKVVSADGDDIATILGSQTIVADLEQIYDNLEYCPDTFRKWVEALTLEPVCEALSMADALSAEAENEAPTWEECLRDRFPLPSDRNLTQGRITLDIPESWNVVCSEKTEILNEKREWMGDEYTDSVLSGTFGMGSCNRVQVHSPDFWMRLSQSSDPGHHESPITFVERCTIEWYDPSVR